LPKIFNLRTDPYERAEQTSYLEKVMAKLVAGTTSS
jgi:hypothetical protein